MGGGTKPGPEERRITSPTSGFTLQAGKRNSITARQAPALLIHSCLPVALDYRAPAAGDLDRNRLGPGSSQAVGKPAAKARCSLCRPAGRGRLLFTRKSLGVRGALFKLLRERVPTDSQIEV